LVVDGVEVVQARFELTGRIVWALVRRLERAYDLARCLGARMEEKHD
jgi:hypothetical protein